MRKAFSLFRYVATIMLLAAAAWPQQISKADRDDAQEMLKVVANEIRKHYYDPKFHGLDWDAKVAEARQKIDKAPSLAMALSYIAGALGNLDDSHTFFLPPQRSYRYSYGVQYQMIGNHCIVTQVRPHSDAEVKGVKPGDEILTLNGYQPTRDTLETIQYIFAALRPQPSLRLKLQDPAGAQREVEVVTKVRQKKRITDLTMANGASDIFEIIRGEETQDHLMRARYADLGDPLLVIQVPEFSFSPVQVAEMIGKARNHKSLIVDLRGNPGGSVETLKHLVSDTFDKDVKITDRVGRKDNKPEIATSSHNTFTGKVIVLVDSRSASAAEIFARLVQIEKRGIVVGDLTSGSVMEAQHYSEKMGADVVSYYGVSVTDADLIMTDGKSLEHVGVTPDQVLLPSAQAVAGGQDPVLAAAAEQLGVKITPEAAGKLFPYEWPPDE
jgi:C-terminal processing protease CtpA/Prc